MKTLDERIKGGNLLALKSLIGHKLIKYRNDEFLGDDTIVGRIGIFTDAGMFVVESAYESFDDFFWGPEDATILGFHNVKEESEMRNEGDALRPVDTPVDEIIDDILIINDHMDVLRSGRKEYDWDSTEGIIFVTKSREYGFLKSDWMDMVMEIVRGHDVASKAEPVNKHWDIFADDLSSINTREIVSLKGKTL